MRWSFPENIAWTATVIWQCNPCTIRDLRLAAPRNLSILIVLALLLTQPHALALWLEILALIALVVMHAIFWTVTQPANRFWLTGANLSGLGASFFAGAPAAQGDWMALRDRWEYSHLARAACAAIAFIALVIASAR